MPNRDSLPAFVLRASALALTLGASGAWALGLGDLRTRSVLGENLVASVELRGSPAEVPESACFRLRPGDDDSLPWLRQAELTLRRGNPSLLEIRSHRPLREPVLRIGILVGCGHDLRREYTLLPTPGEPAEEPVVAPSLRIAADPAPEPVREPRPRPPRPRASQEAAPERLAPARPVRPPRSTPLKDRLILSGGDGEGEPSLRLSTSLSGPVAEDPRRDAERELLRLEFRALAALHEQALSQLAAAEKLRKLESSLGELQQKAGQLAERIEVGQAVQAVPPPLAPTGLSAPSAAALPAPLPQTPAAPQARPAAAAPVSAASGEGMFWGLLLGAAAGLAGWLVWRQRSRRMAVVAADPLTIPEPLMDPPREDERDEPGGVDLAVEPSAMGMPFAVDLPLEEVEASQAPTAAAEPPRPRSLDSAFSISAASVHEHFEVNPVMELAEIMLSFGRVKGAAQALQEYIDQSPKEALQPWIKLLEVYRLANMREEFERVATSLNQNFNVAVLNWEGDARPLSIDFDLDAALPDAPRRPLSLEELPHVVEALVAAWKTPQCGEYLQWLLRDNRGGQRSGFALPVVEEILFLVELRETRERLEKEEANGQG